MRFTYFHAGGDGAGSFSFRVVTADVGGNVGNADFQAPVGTVLGTFQSNALGGNETVHELDATDALEEALAAGWSFLGVRFEPTSDPGANRAVAVGEVELEIRY